MTEPSVASADRDQRLADLLAGLTLQLRQGQFPDLDAATRQHPDLADELRELWAAAQVAEAFARPSADSHRTREYRSPGSSAPATGFVRRPPPSFGDYELLEELGQGGMGVVYKARQKSLHRTVALKLMRGGQMASPTERGRFRTEAESAARLEHPHIVAIHEVGEHDGQAYLCMQYVAGPTLAQRLADGPLPPREAARLLAAVARAVHHAHQRGVLHRDLKPSNVLLDSAGEPFVADFGLAKQVPVEGLSLSSAPGGLTASGAVVGTPGYMPPEQIAGSRGSLGPASDVYSLGAILYEMLTGRPPFQAASAVDTLLLVLEQEPVPPRLLNPGVDRELETICLKCLQKPADLRYPSAAALADDLEAFLRGDALSTQPSGFRYFVSKMLRPTHHAAVLENWGLLWMWHSLALFLLCLLTQVMHWSGPALFDRHAAYLTLWSIGLVTWGTIFWRLRRRAGPVLFVERQLAHAWAAGVCASISMFVVEVLTPLPPLKLSPGIAVAAGMVFVFMAGVLSGEFYVAAGAMFLDACLMALFPDVCVLLFGVVSAACFFVPGLKYYRLRVRARQRDGGTNR